ncbi:hypothetical protein E2C01_010715 [Portunus trituberculatus]|uniref:Uncharacterized protein n=1 Tax=Portunus trituberculatus TaxID=210409 RepID=A0A5B7D954_PORTR|nr:hypothetical protein [Portunus trituberculatus]
MTEQGDTRSAGTHARRARTTIGCGRPRGYARLCYLWNLMASVNVRLAKREGGREAEGAVIVKNTESRNGQCREYTGPTTRRGSPGEREGGSSRGAGTGKEQGMGTGIVRRATSNV